MCRDVPPISHESIVIIVGHFGSFKIKEYKGYAGRNPKTGVSVEVEPKRLPFFRAGKELKEFLNS